MNAINLGTWDLIVLSLKRMEKSDKRNFKEKKEKKTYITWEDNDIDSSSDSENNIINMSLMAKDYESGEELAHW